MPLGLIALGILPSFIWLSIYLKEDEHPEPKKLIFKMFLLGIVFAPIAAGIEFLLISVFQNILFPAIIANFLTFFVFIGLTEEYCKCLAVKLGMLKNKAFDEPADAMIYLIVSALGFAALENILAIFHFNNFSSTVNLGPAIEIAVLRFLSATLLHVLASAIVGYYLARKYFFFEKNSVLKGLLIAASLHGIYNVLTIKSESFQKLEPTILVIIMLGLAAIWVNRLFYKLKSDFFKSTNY